jgi:hypothetical protein
LKKIIKRASPKNPVRKPVQTCWGLCEFNFNLEERISPAIIITATRYQTRGEYILSERSKTNAVRAPAPAEWIEIFHQKLFKVTKRETKQVAKINDLRKTGSGKRNIMNDVVA